MKKGAITNTNMNKKRKEPSSTCGTKPPCPTKNTRSQHVRLLPNGKESKPGGLCKGEVCLKCGTVGGGKRTREDYKATVRRNNTKQRRDQGIQERQLVKEDYDDAWCAGRGLRNIEPEAQVSMRSLS